MIGKGSKLIIAMTFGLLLFLSRAQASFVDSYLLAHPTIMTHEISQMLSERCGAYTHQYSECRYVGPELFRFLDISPILIPVSETQKVNYIFTFKKHLDLFKNSPSVLAFLLDLQRELQKLNQDIETYRFILPESIKPFDLGEFAQPYFATRSEMLLVLATLFQDMPRGSVQVRYLMQNHSDKPFVDLLSNVLQQIANVRMWNGKMSLTVFGIPFLNTKVYHLLVPAAIADHLKSKGISVRVAYASALIFNYLYKAKDAINPLMLTVREPIKILSQDNIGDIIAGEMGARLGAGMPPLDEQDLQFKSVVLGAQVTKYLVDALTGPWEQKK